MSTYVGIKQIEDGINYFDLGVSEARHFFTHSMTSLGLSYTDDFYGNYKIAGLSVFRDLDKITYDRSVYDFAAFMSDVGGIDSIFWLLGALCIGGATMF
jgi:hypothetical protein